MYYATVASSGFVVIMNVSSEHIVYFIIVTPLLLAYDDLHGWVVAGLERSVPEVIVRTTDDEGLAPLITLDKLGVVRVGEEEDTSRYGLSGAWVTACNTESRGALRGVALARFDGFHWVHAGQHSLIPDKAVRALKHVSMPFKVTLVEAGGVVGVGEVQLSSGRSLASTRVAAGDDLVGCGKGWMGDRLGCYTALWLATTVLHNKHFAGWTLDDVHAADDVTLQEFGRVCRVGEE